MTTNNHPNVARFAALARHIDELCRAFDIHLSVRANMPPDAAGAGVVRGSTRRAILIAPVIDESTYAAALHEIGHCVAPMGMITAEHGSLTMRTHNVVSTLRDMRLQLEEEMAAWEWARHYAIEWTELMTAVERMSLNSYIVYARRLGLKEKLR